MGLTSEIKKILKTRFTSGLLVVVPLILTFVLLRSLVESIDSLVRPLIENLLGHDYVFPFAGVIITLAIILLTGILTANVVGGKLVNIWDKQLLKIPIVNFIYGSIRQLIQALSIPQSKSFKSVVMVEYPRKEVFMLGFLVNDMEYEADGKSEKLLSIFIPSTPTPISGYVALFPEADVVFLDMSIEEGIKFFVSASIISPAVLKSKIYANLIASEENNNDNNAGAG